MYLKRKTNKKEFTTNSFSSSQLPASETAAGQPTSGLTGPHVHLQQLLLLTVIDGGNVLPRAVHQLVTGPVSVQDGGERLLVHVADHGSQTCRRTQISTGANGGAGAAAADLPKMGLPLWV